MQSQMQEKTNSIKKMKKPISTFFDNTKKVFKEGGSLDRASVIGSYVFPGLGHVFSKQFIKGIIMMLVTIGYIVFMITWGAASIKGFFTLQRENILSQYNIVYGFVAFVVTAFMIVVWSISIKGTLNNCLGKLAGKKLNSFVTDLKLLTTSKFYILLLIVPVVGALAFTVIPLLFMIAIAFTNFSTNTGAGGVIPWLNVKHLDWTGFASFKYLLSAGDNLKAFGGVMSWTLIWALFATITCFFGGLFLAMLLNKKVVKGKIVWRTLFIIVMATPQIVSLRIMYSMFHNNGPINGVLLNLGWISTRIEFWDNQLIARILIIFINMWVGIPYFMLLMSGLLINIPKDYYEYASIEGASKFYMFKKITMPYILFLTTPVLITSFIQNINNFNVIYLLTGGGPSGDVVNSVAGKTDIMITWLYKLTMQRAGTAEYNLGAAIGIIMFILSITFSLLTYRKSKSYKNEGDFSL